MSGGANPVSKGLLLRYASAFVGWYIVIGTRLHDGFRSAAELGQGVKSVFCTFNYCCPARTLSARRRLARRWATPFAPCGGLPGSRTMI